ncbi:MAG: acetylornithine deacetylase [Methylocystis sp.]|nr:acetylornithine deacetylase [Methylocystis sp.]MCA3583951.1 acetylornithine deacetylase [Methylocystis sp.]MCA3589571.1 acetylornithine deacetylase [Methylocystis sp.]MCA3592455.1 acetylornithine deacetylase [Methylocystis sp.]
MPTPQTLSTIDLLERLVSFDTVSDKSNLPLIAFVRAYLDSHGIPYVVAPNARGDKAAIFATIGPHVDGGVVLSGHTDVVPVVGQAWTADPFTLRREGTRLYGRGACDMKGFDAACLAMAPELKRMDLKAPIHILLSYDEETTCLGVVDTIARMGADLPKPKAVFVGEPTSMQVADAHKSVGTFFTTVHGFEVHSSSPRNGVNAISGGAMIVAELERIFEEMVERGDPTGRFQPPYTSIHVGTINGGTARNITARECRLHWEFRGVPGLDIDEIPRRLQAFVDERVLPRLNKFGGNGSVTTETEIIVPGLAPDPGSAAETLALRLTGSNRTITVPYGSEAGRFQKAGIATVVCGPGDIAQAHQPDEWIEESELRACETFVLALGRELSRST